jgi:hypothetical protein
MLQNESELDTHIYPSEKVLGGSTQRSQGLAEQKISNRTREPQLVSFDIGKPGMTVAQNPAGKNVEVDKA